VITNLALINILVWYHLFTYRQELRIDYINMLRVNIPRFSQSLMVRRTFQFESMTEINSAINRLKAKNEELSQHFQEIIEKDNHNGKVIKSVVIPDYTEVLDLEKQRLHLIARYSATMEYRPSLYSIMKKGYKDEDKFLSMLKELEEKIEMHYKEPKKSSNLAYVEADSAETVSHVKRLDM
jgi:uncharacterized protein YdcH (DUF465 family)